MRSGRGRLDAADDVHQRGLARAAGPQHHHELAALDLERGVLEGVDRQLALAEGLVDVVEADDRLGRRPSPARPGRWLGAAVMARSSCAGLSSWMRVSAVRVASIPGSAMRWMRKPSSVAAMSRASGAASTSPRMTPRSWASLQARLEQPRPRADHTAHGLGHGLVTGRLQHGLGHEHAGLGAEVEAVEQPHDAVDRLRDGPVVEELVDEALDLRLQAGHAPPRAAGCPWTRSGSARAPG